MGYVEPEESRRGNEREVEYRMEIPYGRVDVLLSRILVFLSISLRPELQRETASTHRLDIVIYLT